MDAAAAASRSSMVDDAEDSGRRVSEALRCADVCRTARELLGEEYVWTRWVVSLVLFPSCTSTLEEPVVGGHECCLPMLKINTCRRMLQACWTLHNLKRYVCAGEPLPTPYGT